MTWEIPPRTDWTLRRGDFGIVVWSLQRQCQRLVQEPALADGDFGRQTETAAILLQQFLDVEADGVVGPATQRALGMYLSNRASGLPKNLLLSLMSYESSVLLGAVSWISKGGVDCGMTQRRVLERDFADTQVVERAFDAAYQISLSARTLRERYAAWINLPGIGGRAERCWRTAVLYHNYPALADKLAHDWIAGLSDYYTSPQAWVTSVGLHFPDGAPIRTPLEWGQRYALSSVQHDEPGQAVKLVTAWR